MVTSTQLQGITWLENDIVLILGWTLDIDVCYFQKIKKSFTLGYNVNMTSSWRPVLAGRHGVLYNYVIHQLKDICQVIYRNDNIKNSIYLQILIWVPMCCATPLSVNTSNLQIILVRKKKHYWKSLSKATVNIWSKCAINWTFKIYLCMILYLDYSWI